MKKVREKRDRIRVLFLNDTARNGGPGRSLFSILKFIDTDRIHRIVVLPRPGVISEMLESGGVFEELFFEPLLVENIVEPWSRAMERRDYEAPLPLRGLRALGNVGRAGAGLLRLRRTIERTRTDLIYSNGTNAAFAGGAVAKMSGVPALWHVRYTSIPKLAQPVHDALAKSDEVRRIVCVSEASAALFPTLREKTAVINNALDIDDFSRSRVVGKLRTELGIPKDAVIFGSFGRVLPKKGYIEFIRAAARARALMTKEETDNAWFVVIGDTPEDLRPDHLAECRALVEKEGLGARVHFLGFRADVRPYVADFDVSVVPSVYPDPLPRSVIESMAFELPVIAYDIGGIREMVVDGETGRLLPPPEIEPLAQAFIEYARDALRRRREGKLGRQRVQEKFDARHHAEAIQEQIFRAVGFRPDRENESQALSGHAQ